MIGRPGSTLWLLGHEIRLAWRDAFGGRARARRVIALGGIGIVFTLLGFGLAFALRDAQVPVDRLTSLAADFALVMIFSLMLSQTLAGATTALYGRGDLDLLFSSPLDPRRTLAVRFLSLAASAFAAFGLLITPIAVPLAIFGHWRWLAIYPLLGALALAASAVGLALAVGLFAVIGPRRTRAVAQVLAALIGAAFFLATQVRNLFGAHTSTYLAQIARAANDPRLRLPAAASWPLRAAIGEPIPLAIFLGAGGGVFAVVTYWLSARFAADAAAAQGVSAAPSSAPRGPARAFVAGPFAATFQKELRLLRRDAALLAQVLLRVLFLVPAAFVLLRNAAQHAGYALPGGAAAVAMLAGQVGSSLTWITVSAEDAPELLASAPAAASALTWAKLLAGLAPLAVVLAGPLAAITLVSPLTGLAASAGAAASALAAGLINVWRPSPGRRSDFRRRRAGSLATSLALFFVTALIAAATALAAAASPFALLPAAVAVAALLALRRPPERIAEATAAAR